MKNFYLLFVLCLSLPSLKAQDMDQLMDEHEQPIDTEYVNATFKGTRIINAHSTKLREKGTFDFLISHRFGRVNLGIEELFGLDQSNIRFALEYAFLDQLTVGLGRSSFEKTYDGFLKYKFLRQSSGTKNTPVSIVFFASVAFKTIKDFSPDNEPSFGEKLSYTSQFLIARKFSPSFSFQLSPTWVHYNLVRQKGDPHNIFALGGGSRLKISKRVTFNAEYFYTFNPLKSLNTKNSLAFGLDIETGGHVFQLMFTNSITMIEKGFITETTGDFLDGDIHFGFNISRTF